MNARMSDQAGGEVHEPVEQAGDEEVRELDTLAETRSAPPVDDNQITRGVRESRCLPFSSVAQREADAFDESVDSSRFFPADHDRWPGHWALAPTRWETPEGALLAGETRNFILRAVDELPPAQRAIITLRDIEGWPPQEVCDVLGVSDGNQRLLLHRARSKVRSAVEQYFGAVEV